MPSAERKTPITRTGCSSIRLNSSHENAILNQQLKHHRMLSRLSITQKEHFSINYTILTVKAAYLPSCGSSCSQGQFHPGLGVLPGLWCKYSQNSSGKPRERPVDTAQPETPEGEEQLQYIDFFLLRNSLSAKLGAPACNPYRKRSEPRASIDYSVRPYLEATPLQVAFFYLALLLDNVYSEYPR